MHGVILARFSSLQVVPVLIIQHPAMIGKNSMNTVYEQLSSLAREIQATWKSCCTHSSGRF